MTVRLLSVSPYLCPSCANLDKEEGQFDDAEEDEPRSLLPCEQPLPPTPIPSPVPSPQLLPPCEQPLPPSLPSSPTPSPVPSQVSMLAQKILEVRRLAAETGIFAAASLDIPTIAAKTPKDKGTNDETPMDTSVQEESLSAVSEDSHSATPKESVPPAPLPPSNLGRGALIKQLFAPRGAFAAPRMVRPPPVARKPAKELTALEPSPLPPLLLRTHVRPMTIEYGHKTVSMPAPPPVGNRIKVALDQVTSPQSGPFNPAN